jgi:hypothetical protein
MQKQKSLAILYNSMPTLSRDGSHKCLNKSKLIIDKNRHKTTKNSNENLNLPLDFKNLKKIIRQSKVLRLLPNVCDFQKEN